MTHSYDVDHGLSQCPPGPLEPVELAQQPGAAPATGNTARDQEMYVAGIRTGEENAKHNAAIRAGAGWLPIESAPKDGTLVLLFARLAGVNFATNSPYAPTIHVGAYRADLCIWTGLAYRDQREIEIEPTHWMPRPAFPDCAAPGVSTGEQDERSATHGMTLGERIAHVGGRTNAQGYIEFGSPMAVNALIQHVLRDIDCTRQEDDGAYQARYRLPSGQWSTWGHVVCGVKGHEQELRYLPGERRPAPAAGDAIRDLIAKHAELLDKSDHTYFELARTRQTGWMAWLCSHPAETHPDRKVLARGQGETPDEACREALADFEMRAAIAAQRKGDA